MHSRLVVLKIIEGENITEVDCEVTSRPCRPHPAIYIFVQEKAVYNNSSVHLH